MPIIGMTDRGASFPRIGELRKGAAKPTQGNAPGKDLDHFRFTSLNADVVAQFRTVYGDEPQEVHCFLPYATTDENFEAWIEEWGAGSLKWRGNGQTLVIWQKPDGTYSQEPKPQPAKGGKQVGRLKVILPALGRLAYVVALTTSVNDIIELHSNLTAYQALRGDLRGIPFILSRVPRMISTPGKDSRVRREKWLLHLEAAPEWVQAQLSVMERQALPGGPLSLPSGDIAPDDDDYIDVTPEDPAPQPITPGNASKLPPTPDATTRNQHNAAGISWGELGNGKKFPDLPERMHPDEIKLSRRGDYEMHISPADKPAPSFNDLGNDDSPGTIDEDKWQLFRGRVQSNPRNTVATVCNAAAMTGAYRAEGHALNAALSISADLERGLKLNTEDALSLFDKLIERKRQPQLITVDTPATDAGYAE